MPSARAAAVFAIIVLSAAVPRPAAAQVNCPTPVVEGVTFSADTKSFQVILHRDIAISDPDNAMLAGSMSASVVGSTANIPVTLEPVAGFVNRVRFNLPEFVPAGTELTYRITGITGAQLNCTATFPIEGRHTVLSTDDALALLAERIAHAKTSEEKDLFGSFVVARGEDGGKAAGAADIVINRTLVGDDTPTIGSLFDTADLNVRIKKSSAENADPRAFDAGLTLEKVMLLGNARAYLQCSQRATCTSAELTALRESRGFFDFFRTLLIDEAVRLESDAFAFESVNFVNDAHLQLGSIAAGLGQKGYYALRLHGGAEIGRTLQKPTALAGTSGGISTQTVDWVRRGKAGLETTLRFLPGDDRGDRWAVEFGAKFVSRRLFADEVFIEEITNADNETVPTRVTVGKGHKPWTQIDAKVFFFADANARYGFRLSYMKGSLPPTFKETRGFQFGFIIETSDDKSSGTPADSSQ